MIYFVFPSGPASFIRCGVFGCSDVAAKNKKTQNLKKEKRYYVTAVTTIYARNDNEAKVKAAKFAEENDSIVTELVCLPFACLTERMVHKGSLTIFKNKIIETT